jgi:surface antigen
MNRDPAHNSIPDETLMRFVDGDLSRDEEAVVAAEIARNPQLEKRLEPFRFTKTLAGFYAPSLDVSPQLMERFLGPDVGTAPSFNEAPSNLATVSRRKQRSWRRQFMALAAACALLLVGAAGWLLRDGLHPHGAALAPASLQQALEETPQHGLAKLADGSSISLNTTFVSQQRQWCREYEVLNANGTQVAGLACRGADGIWRVEIEEHVASTAQSSENPKAYVPAGRERPRQREQKEGVAEFRDRIMGADVSLQEELDLIKDHWRGRQ